MFARSARKLEEELENHLGSKSAPVGINSLGKPGKGNFVVTVKGTEIFALRSMPRPFKQLREADLAEVASKVVKELAK